MRDKGTDRAATGIIELDRLLGGGLPRARGYLILGSPGAGKTTFAVQILFEALRRGEPCVYVSYSAAYWDFAEWLRARYWDLQPYMERGNFRFIDHCSLGIGSFEPPELTDVEQHSVHLVQRDIDDDSYIALHERIRAEIGNSGINVIDDVSDYLRYVSPGRALARQERLRRLFARKGGLIGLHVLTPSQQQESNGQFLQRMEDATFELKRNKDEHFLSLRCRFINIDEGWFNLVKRPEGLALGSKIGEIGDTEAPLIVLIDDFDSFAAVRSVPSHAANSMVPVTEPESVIKGLFESVLSEPFHQKDWGGEQNDIFSSRVVLDGHRRPAAFLLKGPAVRGPLTIAKCGRNGDQLQRLFRSPADVFVIQFNGEISQAVFEEARQKVAHVRSQGNQAAVATLIDGADTARLLLAHKSSLGPR